MKSTNLMKMIFLVFSLLLSCKNSDKQSSSEQGPKDPACAGKIPAQCAAAADCTTSGTDCIASSGFCSQFSDQNSCGKMNSCQWNSSSQSCVVPSTATITPTPIVTPAVNTTTACTLLDQVSCQARTTDCQWNGTSCTDLTTTNCYQYAQAQCPASVCSWNGTQCIPASTTNTIDTAGCAAKTVLMCFLAPTCTWGLPFGPCTVK